MEHKNYNTIFNSRNIRTLSNLKGAEHAHAHFCQKHKKICWWKTNHCEMALTKSPPCVCGLLASKLLQSNPLQELNDFVNNRVM